MIGYIFELNKGNISVADYARVRKECLKSNASKFELHFDNRIVLTIIINLFGLESSFDRLKKAINT